MNGKDFEKLIQESADKQGLDCTRLRDAGYRGEETERRFTITNICDFIMFDGVTHLYMEAKHRKDRVEFDGLSQLDDLAKKQVKPRSKHIKVSCGFLFCLKGRFFYMPVMVAKNLRDTLGKKSMNLDDVIANGFEVFTFLPKRARKERLNLVDMMDKLGVIHGN